MGIWSPVPTPWVLLIGVGRPQLENAQLECSRQLLWHRAKTLVVFIGVAPSQLGSAHLECGPLLQHRAFTLGVYTFWILPNLCTR